MVRQGVPGDGCRLFAVDHGRQLDFHAAIGLVEQRVGFALARPLPFEAIDHQFDGVRNDDSNEPI